MSNVTTLGGPLGQALDANLRGRLSTFITDESSPAIALFRPENVARNEEGDWYGEHAGKWLVAAAKAAQRTRNPAITQNLQRVANYLVSVQQDDGYLGTYAPGRRFTVKQVAAASTWDGAPAQRTWDIWTHAYLMLGLLETSKTLADPRYLDAACKIADLLQTTLTKDGIDITTLGNHYGMSATVILDAVVDLHFATGKSTYLELARLILSQADARPELALLSHALAGVDAAEIGTGKAYQLCWNVVGIAKLYRATGDPRFLAAARNVWNSIREHHLTLGGGPWGGVAHRSREVFNHRSVFSPEGYVETCATLAWIQLNRELMIITGEAVFAEEIERSAYNDLLGAQAPNGEDWCYYSFPNGRRVYTTYWRCCKSSGAMALEELPAIVCQSNADGDITVNLYGNSIATLVTPQVGEVVLEQVTEYPFDGRVTIEVRSQRSATYTVYFRIPSWAVGTRVELNGIARDEAVQEGAYLPIRRQWQDGDKLVLMFPMRPVLHRRAAYSVQESRAPDGASIQQEVMRQNYVAITRGPLVYATGLIDGYKMHESIRLSAKSLQDFQQGEEVNSATKRPAIRLNADGRSPLEFVPYFEAGGRRDGTWRLTWIELAT